MKTAVLIQSHKNEKYIHHLAKDNVDVNFYVHMDAKFPEKIRWLEKNSLPNLSVVKDPVSVFWGGSSQVTATIKLMEIAAQCVENFYFHLISSECVILKSFTDIEKEWDQHAQYQFIESHRDQSNEWRLKVRVPHSDTKYLRTFWGRCFNKALKFYSYLHDGVKIPSENYYFGSQWFSVTRDFVNEVLQANRRTDFFSSFKNITCADEHAFAIFSKTLYSNSSYVQDNNKRFIRFSGKASPDYLDENCIQMLVAQKKFWFARKVADNILLKKVR